MKAIADAGVGPLPALRLGTEGHPDAVHRQRLQIAETPGEGEEVLGAGAEDRWFGLAVHEPAVVALDVSDAVHEDPDHVSRAGSGEHQEVLSGRRVGNIEPVSVEQTVVGARGTRVVEKPGRDGDRLSCFAGEAHRHSRAPSKRHGEMAVVLAAPATQPQPADLLRCIGRCKEHAEGRGHLRLLRVVPGHLQPQRVAEPPPRLRGAVADVDSETDLAQRSCSPLIEQHGLLPFAEQDLRPDAPAGFELCWWPRRLTGVAPPRLHSSQRFSFPGVDLPSERFHRCAGQAKAVRELIEEEEVAAAVPLAPAVLLIRIPGHDHDFARAIASRKDPTASRMGPGAR